MTNEDLVELLYQQRVSRERVLQVIELARTLGRLDAVTAELSRGDKESPTGQGSLKL